MKFKIDLHTHSVLSHDGGISLGQYRNALESGTLDCIAVTDHNRIDFATQAKTHLGDRIIVGEEIMTTEGEIIGLFLTDTVKPGMTPQNTVEAIKAQGGVVYIPHPFETIRKGLHPQALELIQDYVDIIETFNGRVLLQNNSRQTLLWAKLNKIAQAASSDAHGKRGLGATYTTMPRVPNRDNLVELLGESQMVFKKPTLQALLYPKYNKVYKKLHKEKV